MAAPVPAALKEKRHVRGIGLAWLALIALAGASWGLANVPLGAWAAPVALAIAVAKALIVAMVFMRMAHAAAVSRLALLIAFGFISLLALGVASDVLLR